MTTIENFATSNAAFSVLLPSHVISPAKTEAMAARFSLGAALVPLLISSTLISSLISLHYLPPSPSTLQPVLDTASIPFERRQEWQAQTMLAAIEVIVGATVWKVGMKGRTDAALVGLVVGLVARLPTGASSPPSASGATARSSSGRTALFLNKWFLIPLPSLIHHTLAHLLAPFISLSLLPYLVPPHPRFSSSSHLLLSSLVTHPPSLVHVFDYLVGVGLATLVGGLMGYTADRIGPEPYLDHGLRSWIETHATWRSVPVKLAEGIASTIPPAEVMRSVTSLLPL